MNDFKTIERYEQAQRMCAELGWTIEKRRAYLQFRLFDTEGNLRLSTKKLDYLIYFLHGALTTSK